MFGRFVGVMVSLELSSCPRTRFTLLQVMFTLYFRLGPPLDLHRPGGARRNHDSGDEDELPRKVRHDVELLF